MHILILEHWRDVFQSYGTITVARNNSILAGSVLTVKAETTDATARPDASSRRYTYSASLALNLIARSTVLVCRDQDAILSRKAERNVIAGFLKGMTEILFDRDDAALFVKFHQQKDLWAQVGGIQHAAQEEIRLKVRAHVGLGMALNNQSFWTDANAGRTRCMSTPRDG